MDEGEPGVGAGPVPVDRGWSGQSNDRSQRERHDDHIVCVPEDWDEVRDEVYGEDEVGQEETESRADAAGDRSVPGQCSQQPYEVGHEPLGLLEVDAAGLDCNEDRHEHGPGDGQREANPDGRG